MLDTLDVFIQALSLLYGYGWGSHLGPVDGERRVLILRIAGPMTTDIIITAELRLVKIGP